MRASLRSGVKHAQIRTRVLLTARRCQLTLELLLGDGRSEIVVHGGRIEDGTYQWSLVVVGLNVRQVMKGRCRVAQGVRYGARVGGRWVQSHRASKGARRPQNDNRSRGLCVSFTAGNLLTMAVSTQARVKTNVEVDPRSGTMGIEQPKTWGNREGCVEARWRLRRVVLRLPENVAVVYLPCPPCRKRASS